MADTPHSPARILELILRTPDGPVFHDSVRGLRVPTDTGQVGLRPRGEPLIADVERGLVVIHRQRSTSFAATVGGLLSTDGTTCTIYTPFAAIGDDDTDVLDRLAKVLASPSQELEVRRMLGRLEQQIMQELRSPDRRTGTKIDRHG